MFAVIGFILIFILFIFLFGITFIAALVRGLFSRNKRNNAYTQGYSQQQPKSDRIDGHPKRKKYFDDEEGEYVDFEEVKE
jgi:hypothetical protein